MGKWYVFNVGNVDEGMTLDKYGDLVGTCIGEFPSIQKWIEDYANPYETSGFDVFEVGGCGHLGLPTSPGHLYNLWVREEAAKLEEILEKIEREGARIKTRIIEWEGELFIFMKG